MYLPFVLICAGITVRGESGTQRFNIGQQASDLQWSYVEDMIRMYFCVGDLDWTDAMPTSLTGLRIFMKITSLIYCDGYNSSGFRTLPAFRDMYMYMSEIKKSNLREDEFACYANVYTIMITRIYCFDYNATFLLLHRLQEVSVKLWCEGSTALTCRLLRLLYGDTRYWFRFHAALHEICKRFFNPKRSRGKAVQRATMIDLKNIMSRHKRQYDIQSMLLLLKTVTDYSDVKPAINGDGDLLKQANYLFGGYVKCLAKFT